MLRGGILLFITAFAACSGPPSDVRPFSNDPLSVKQGYMLALGVPDGWPRASAPVIVAVLDNGIDFEHPDLSTRIWVNSNEVPGNGIDDDGDGHVDDVHGWNFLDNDGDVGLSAAELRASDFSHGTKVAGTIGAETNNNQGVASGCPVCTMMILKGRDFLRTGTSVASFAAAIDYAIAHGVRVLNVSDGVRVGSISDELVSELEAAAQRAEQAGILIVASAGNEGSDTVLWPARIPSVLAVAAVDWSGVPASFTNFGREVAVAAPGDYIETTMPGGKYGYFGGTSASAPIVTALAGMLFSEHPDWTPAQVAARIEATAHPAKLESRPDIGSFGAGVVNFGDALAE